MHPIAGATRSAERGCAMHRHGPIPTGVWIALITLTVIGTDFLIVGFARDDPPQIVGALACAGLIWALAKGVRWAHALTLLFIGAGTLTLLLQNRDAEAIAALFVTACIWIPLLVDSGWFWRPHAHYPSPTSPAA